jgi:hypothetical protein
MNKLLLPGYGEWGTTPFIKSLHHPQVDYVKTAAICYPVVQSYTRGETIYFEKFLKKSQLSF